MIKFDLDTLKSLCKSMFDHWKKAGKTDTNIGSNGNGSSLEVPRTTDLWESRPVPYPLGNGVKNSLKSDFKVSRSNFVISVSLQVKFGH